MIVRINVYLVMHPQLNAYCYLDFIYESEVVLVIKSIISVTLKIKDVSYRPPGTQVNLLNGVSFSLPEKRYISRYTM